MSTLATTKMTSKGQVVIPEEIRRRLHLQAGTRFVVVADRDTVIFKTIEPPSLDEFDDLIAEARKQAEKAGLTESDIEAAIEEVRRRK